MMAPLEWRAPSEESLSRSRLAPLGNAPRFRGQAGPFRGRLFHRRADVLFDQAAGQTDVARQYGVAQFQMLVPPPRASVDHGQPMVAPRLVEQLAAEMHGPRRSTGRHQRIVESLVPLAPFALDADRVVLPWGAELVEQEIRTHDLGLPGGGAVGAVERHFQDLGHGFSPQTPR